MDLGDPINRAKQAGYSDDEIKAFLAGRFEKEQKAGLTDEQISGKVRASQYRVYCGN